MMGLNASTVAGRDRVDLRHIVATPFNGGRQFKIWLPSRDVLAEGSSAALLKGKMKHPSNPRGDVDVALKVFRFPTNAEQKELYLRLYRRELEAATRLSAWERYILPFLGTSVLDYQPVIVSLYMTHGNLLDYIRQNNVYRPLLVAEALTFLHTEAGIVHGDLKCENVLVSDEGTPLLADFGLSTLIDKAAGEGTTDTSLRVRNTVRFAAPELLADTAGSSSGRIRSKTTQSDVWAFGMLIIQAFTLNPPWPGYDNHIVAMKALSGERHPHPGQEATRRGLTNGWWDLCLKCWDTAPEQRPPVGNVLAELRERGEPWAPCSAPVGWLSLPAKLWLSILAHVSALPWALDPVSLAPSALLQWDSLHFPISKMVQFYTASQNAKLCLALVSRSMLSVALPELYRYVWLHKRGQARRLAETMEAHPEHGPWIHRLDIDCQAGCPGAMQASALDVRRILEPCTGLIVLLDRQGTYVDVRNHAAHWPAMLTPHAPALRRCAISHYGELTRTGPLLNVLAGMGAFLEVLEIDVSLLDLWQEADADEALPVDLPRLHTLEITLSPHESCAPLLAVITRWKLRSLTTLRLLGKFAPSLELRAFVDTHGSNVKLLELGAADLPPHIFSSQPAPRPPWVFAPASLPELQTLVVTASRTYRIPHPMLPAHGGITVLGIRDLERKVRKMHSQGVLGQLGDCMPTEGRFPALREIHTLTYGESPTARLHRDAEVLVLQLFWRRLVQQAQEGGDVTVCDTWGRPIVLPTGTRDRGWGVPPKPVQL